MSSHGGRESKTRLNKQDQRGRQLLSEHQNQPNSCWGKGDCGVYSLVFHMHNTLNNQHKGKST